MSGFEHLKYDLRVRERMLEQGTLTDGEVRAHLAALPDVEHLAEPLELDQPALSSRREDDPAAHAAPVPVSGTPAVVTSSGIPVVPSSMVGLTPGISAAAALPMSSAVIPGTGYGGRSDGS